MLEEDEAEHIMPEEGRRLNPRNGMNLPLEEK